MKLYLLGGLGADERVFKFLDLEIPSIVITWIEPLKNESLSSYSRRIAQQIDTSEKFGLLGVSFGGIIAIEIGKIITPEEIILVSSVESSDQLPKKYITIGKTGIFKFIPNVLIKPQKFLLSFMFGAKNKQILEEIIDDTKPEFIKWALNSILKWNNYSNESKTVRIHGTKDKVIPLIGNAIKIEGGGHFMIVDKANEVSRLVNDRIKNAG